MLINKYSTHAVHTHLQMREIMASLGFSKVEDMVGRSDMMETDTELVSSHPKVRDRLMHVMLLELCTKNQ